MITKLGININMNEARVLVASGDEDYNGNLELPEFISLIFGDNDALNVDLKRCKQIYSNKYNYYNINFILF